ncbi:autophagy-related protein 22-like protein [Lobosporangium transversale]|uniref:Autophagy-related protein n=1 Tax=Lobosporangium transversale TaxID=64571 RepID=A0A1Y2GGS4_9FUNG|nr:autophagy-related protein 22-like protein [Lobosporangium transversale]ORZ10588.1 autophagy-related protein 22-like protein [Lobosporangium transversale]|eukprot:XP_021879309.1 autophagy-related protein 22-like protein [Lobosporangium transversale]
MHQVTTRTSDISSMEQVADLNMNYEEKQKHSHSYQHPLKALKKSELWAWYIQSGTHCGYGYVAGITLIPLLIQDTASKIGVEAHDHSIPCDTTVPGFKCVTSVFGHYLEPGTISLYISSLSSVLCFVVSLSISAVADYGSYRKTLMIVFSVLGCVNSFGFFVLQQPSLLWVATILTPLGWTLFNVCGVFSYSFLPLYGRAHPDVLAAETSQVAYKIEEQKINDMASYTNIATAWGLVLTNLICIGISQSMGQTTLSLAIAIAFTGLLWLVGMLAIAPWLDPRPNEPLPKGTNWVLYSWKKTYNTLRAFRKLPEIFKFMFAWFILSDGISTIPSVLMIILYRELGFTHTDSLIIAVVQALTATVGIYILMWVRKAWSLTTRTMILMTVGFYVVFLCYLAIVPYLTDNLGLRHKGEGWFCYVYTGLIVGTFYASTRAMLSELCPEGDENEWFSLYLLADRGSSW